METRWVMLFLTIALATAGCSADREKQLLGKWKGDVLSSTFAAVKLKDESGASQEDAKNAAKIMAATFVELKADKSFTAAMAGVTASGTYTFNKETGEVVMKISKLLGPDQQEVPAGDQLASSWTAYLSQDNDKLSFYAAPPESVALIRKADIKGGMTQGISLFKK